MRGFLDLIEPRADLSASEKAQQFALRLRELSDKLGVPRFLTRWGVTKANVEEAARHLLPLQGAFDQNPVPFSADQDALDLLKKHVE